MVLSLNQSNDLFLDRPGCTQAASVIQRAYRNYSKRKEIPAEDHHHASCQLDDIMQLVQMTSLSNASDDDHQRWGAADGRPPPSGAAPWIDKPHNDHRVTNKSSLTSFAIGTSYNNFSLDRRSSLSKIPGMSHVMAGGSLPRGGRFQSSGSKQQCSTVSDVEDVENIYAPFRNLSSHLPNARKYSGTTMPALMPLVISPTSGPAISSTDLPLLSHRDDDQESEVCSVIADIPPLLAPVQSHAVLQESLGHEIPPASIPKTPMAHHPRLAVTKLDLAKTSTPPLPPKRISSKLSMRGQMPSMSVINSIYANFVPNRSSLMSTGSSESSSGTSSPASAMSSNTAALSPSAIHTEAFSWPSYGAFAESIHPTDSSDEHRSVSQIGDSLDSSDISNIYVPMAAPSHFSSRPPQGEMRSPWMNLLYQRTSRMASRSHSVGSDRSPFMTMNRSVEHQDSLSDESLSTTMMSLSSTVTQSSSSQADTKSHKRKSFLGRSISSGASSKAYLHLKHLVKEMEQKRLYRVGINLFNSKPELGIEYLAKKHFLELEPNSLARFLCSQENGLSKDKIGQFLCNLQSPLATETLTCFLHRFNFTGQRIDKALRKLMKSVRVPGEAQKIERLMEEFGKRYVQCNPSFGVKLNSHDSVVPLAFAVMLLNTDLHSPNVREQKRMSLDDFINNLKGLDNGDDFDPKLLKSIYRAIKKEEMVGGSDHVAQTHLIQQAIQQGSNGSATGAGSMKKLPFLLAEPHRRLVCMCRLYEVTDTKKSSRTTTDASQQRDLLLFNDLLVVTRLSNKSSKHSPAYIYRDCFLLQGLHVSMFESPVCPFGIRISRKSDATVVLTLNSASEHDRYKFVMDLQESILEMNEMHLAMNEMAR